MLVPSPNLAKLGVFLLISTTFVVGETNVLSWGTLKNLAEYTVKALGNKVNNFAQNTTNDLGKKVRILEGAANITIGNQVRDLGKKVRDLEEAASINLGNRVHDLGSTVHDFARNTTQDVGNKVENLGTKVSDFARNTTKDLENKVRNLEDAAAAANISFGRQVEDLGNKVKDTVKDGGQVILGTASSWFDIFSKSSIPSSLAVAKLFPSKFRLLSGKELSKSTVFGIRNTFGWVFRIDRPHRGASYDHINYNTFFTGQPDPHDRLPYGVVPTLGAVSTFSNLVGKIITFVAMAADALLIGETAVKEYNETGSLGQETAKSTVIVGARWFGAFAGATVGNIAGSLIGSLISCLCCGMLEPLQAIGSILGYLSGAVAGGFLLNDVVQAAMKNPVASASLVLYNILCLIFFVLFGCLCCFCNSRG